MYVHSTSSVQVNSIHCCSFTLKSSDHMVRISVSNPFFPRRALHLVVLVLQKRLPPIDLIYSVDMRCHIHPH